MLENEKNKLKQIENESRIDNLKEFVNALSEFENLDDFLEHVGLVNENQKKIQSNSVKLMTFNKADHDSDGVLSIQEDIDGLV